MCPLPAWCLGSDRFAALIGRGQGIRWPDLDEDISLSRRRGSALALVNPAYTSQKDDRTALLQGRRQGDRFYCKDGVVLDADANAACNIRTHLYHDEIMLWMPYPEVQALCAERTRPSVGAAPPGLELRDARTRTLSTESEAPRPARFKERPCVANTWSLHMSPP